MQRPHWYGRWAKFLVVFIAIAVAFVVDKPIGQWALGNPITFKSDINLEMIMLMQWGQWTCSVLVIIAVALLDKQGRKKAIALAVGCICAVAVCYLIKGLCGGIYAATVTAAAEIPLPASQINSRGAGAVTPAAAWAGDSGFTPETMGGRPGTGEVTLTMPAGYGQRAQPKYAANYLSN